MKIGTMGNAINDGSIDQIVAEARQVADDGLHTYWVPQIFGHDALTALAIVGTEAEVRDQLHEVASVGATDLNAGVFPGNPEENERTRALLREFV